MVTIPAPTNETDRRCPGARRLSCQSLFLLTTHYWGIGGRVASSLNCLARLDALLLAEGDNTVANTSEEPPYVRGNGRAASCQVRIHTACK